MERVKCITQRGHRLQSRHCLAALFRRDEASPLPPPLPQQRVGHLEQLLP